MDALESKVPPPVVTLLLAGAMKVVASIAPTLQLPSVTGTAAAAVLFAAGLLVEAAGAVSLLRAGTTFDPTHPRSASVLVVSGMYRLTRNPIYLGDLLLLLGWAVFLESPLALAMTPLFVLYIDRLQIRPEERALSELFGERYDEYRARVRRWL
jgi:protein-S-isoprenylcysteine O-methyltransferase Ste14